MTFSAFALQEVCSGTYRSSALQQTAAGHITFFILRIRYVFFHQHHDSWNNSVLPPLAPSAIAIRLTIIIFRLCFRIQQDNLHSGVLQLSDIALQSNGRNATSARVWWQPLHIKGLFISHCRKFQDFCEQPAYKFLALIRFHFTRPALSFWPRPITVLAMI